MERHPYISASIVVYDSPTREVRKAVDCLKADGVDCIYLICNGPAASRITPEAFPEATILATENRGYGAGHNIAMRESLKNGSKYHLVLNADVSWQPSAVRAMIEFMDGRPDVSLVSPKTFYPDGEIQHTCRMLPTPFDMFIRLTTPEWMFSGRKKRYLLASKDPDKALDVPYILGCFMLFRTDALRRHGLFDERFFMYPEDIDITRRIHCGGEKTLYWPGATIIHHHCRASRHSLRMMMVHIRNMARYFNKWGWLRDPERKRANRCVMKAIHSQVSRE